MTALRTATSMLSHILYGGQHQDELATALAKLMPVYVFDQAGTRLLANGEAVTSGRRLALRNADIRKVMADPTPLKDLVAGLLRG
jgi:hypothetical protein